MMYFHRSFRKLPWKQIYFFRESFRESLRRRKFTSTKASVKASVKASMEANILPRKLPCYEVPSVEACTKHVRGSYSYGSFHEGFHESFHGSDESFRGGRGIFHRSDGSSHGSVHELPPIMQAVQVALLVAFRSYGRPPAQSTSAVRQSNITAVKHSGVGPCNEHISVTK